MSCIPVEGRRCESCGWSQLATRAVSFADPISPAIFHLCETCAREAEERGFCSLSLPLAYEPGESA